MNVLDLFSGIGGFSLGLERAGMHTVAFCEIEPYCRAVLKKHWPEIPCHDDIREVDFSRYKGAVDIVCGGFPCQDISLAGRRAGISVTRSGLYREMVRAIRMVRPRFAFMENVAALLNFGMGKVLGDMAESGYDSEWDCISADDVGAPHGRDRVWITFADADKLKWANWSYSHVGWWLWRKEEIEAFSDADSDRKLQPPRLLGEIRRRLDNATGEGNFWPCDWQTQFEAFRRMDDGLSDGLDKNDNGRAVKALGNSIIPQIAEAIGQAIMQYEGGRDV